MEISEKSKLTKEKFYTRAFNTSSASAKNINDSFKINKKIIPKANKHRKSAKNNLNKIISKYNYIKYRSDQKYIKCDYDSNLYNHISLKKKNIIKINVNYKGSMRPKSKSKSKNKSQSNYIKINNNSLLLSERLKNKTLNLLSGFNSENKIHHNHNYINSNENLVLDNIKFDSKKNDLNETSPKTTRKNNNNDFDLEKNFEYFKELENKIREIQNRIKYAKKSLYSNETNYINNNSKSNHNNNSNQSSSKNIEQISIPKIGDLIVYNKNNKFHNNSKNNTVKSDSKKSSLNNNFNNGNTKNKN